MKFLQGKAIKLVQLILKYYSSSKRELLQKRSQVMALIFINPGGVMIQFSLILFLIMTRINKFSEVTDYDECKDTLTSK